MNLFAKKLEVLCNQFIENDRRVRMSKMIPIKGKDISEDTIVEALKKHIGFEERTPKHGDYGYFCGLKSDPMILLQEERKNVFRCIDRFGIWRLKFSDWNNVRLKDWYSTNFEYVGNIFKDLTHVD